jgi:hypothetical protein
MISLLQTLNLERLFAAIVVRLSWTIFKEVIDQNGMVSVSNGTVEAAEQALQLL